MDLNLVQLFLEVVKTKNFSSASLALGVERSTVSRGIATLESALGTRLFSRTTRKLALTSAGTAFYHEVHPLMEAMHGAISGASENEERPSGMIRMSVPVDMAVTFMPDLIAAFTARYPGVRFDLRIENRKADIVQEGIDVALRIVFETLPDSTLLATRLSRLDFYAYATPGYLLRSGHPTDAANAARMSWLTFRGEQMQGFPMPDSSTAIQADDMRFLHQAALSGLGLAILPSFLAQPDVIGGRLVPVLPESLTHYGELYFLHPPAKRMPRRVRVLLDFMKNYLKAYPLTSSA